MYSSVKIENLRGIREGVVEDLAPLTVLVGPNNSGKSTVLEGLYLGLGGDVNAAAKVVLRRGWCGLGL